MYDSPPRAIFASAPQNEGICHALRRYIPLKGMETESAFTVVVQGIAKWAEMGRNTSEHELRHSRCRRYSGSGRFRTGAFFKWEVTITENSVNRVTFTKYSLTTLRIECSVSC